MTRRPPAVIVATLLATACGDKPVEPSAAVVSTISLSSPGNRCPGDTVRLTAIPRDARGNTVTGAMVTWSSLNTAVATVSRAGLVQAVGGGTTTIRATAGTVFSEAPISVYTHQIAFGYRFPSLFVGDTLSLTAVVTEGGGLTPAAPPASWTSLASGIATVSNAGLVTAVAAGAADVEARSPCGDAGRVTVVVLAPRVGTPREIVYTADTVRADGVSANYAISVTASGTGAVPVSAPGNFIAEWAWSSDGSKLAFNYADAASRVGTYIANADGSGEYPLSGTLQNLEWSPDGSRVVYRNYISSGESDVYSARAFDGGDARRLTSALGDDILPRWSPDGRQILYTRQPLDPVPELWIMAADSSGRRQVMLPTGAMRPAWSPDGRFIAFDNGVGIWVVNADGSNPRPLTSNCASNGTCSTAQTYQEVAWSPDGRRIAFTRYEPSRDLVVADFNGTGIASPTLIAAGLTPSLPRWSPNGLLLAFTGTKETGAPWPAAGVINADGTGLVWLSGAENAGGPRWRPPATSGSAFLLPR